MSDPICELGHPVREDGSHVRPEDQARHGQPNDSTERHGIKRWLQYPLMRDLAAGEKTRAQLAREHGVARSSITEFAQRHKAQIQEIKRNLDDEFAGLWAARKANRIAEYQHDAEVLPPGGERTGVLKAMAEELGQLPSRGVTVSGQVTHIIEGVDVGDLR